MSTVDVNVCSECNELLLSIVHAYVSSFYFVHEYKSICDT